MKKLARLTAAAMMALAIGILPITGASADGDDGAGASCVEDDDHDRAFVAVANEQILPLSKILEMLLPQLGGALIEIEFECSDGVYVYEFEVRTPEGRIIEIKVDAVTGTIIPDED